MLAKPTFKCTVLGCSKTYARRNSLSKHIGRHIGRKVKCNEKGCGKEYTSREVLNRHIREVHRGLKRPSRLKKHEETSHQRRQTPVHKAQIERLKRAILEKDRLFVDACQAHNRTLVDSLEEDLNLLESEAKTIDEKGFLDWRASTWKDNGHADEQIAGYSTATSRE